MALLPMYPGKVNSPQTELASAIDDEQTTIPLLDASVLPDPPNLATIGTGEDAETILYTGVSGNDLTGVTRGFQGTAKSWGAGVKVARYFTAYDYDALRQNTISHASRHASGGADPLTPAMIGAATAADLAAHLADFATFKSGTVTEVINIKEAYGAGQGGDDGQILNDIMADLGTTPATLIVPKGNYNLNTTVTVRANKTISVLDGAVFTITDDIDGFIIEGNMSGIEGAWIKTPADYTKSAITITENDGHRWNQFVKKFFLEGTGGKGTGIKIAPKNYGLMNTLIKDGHLRFFENAIEFNFASPAWTSGGTVSDVWQDFNVNGVNFKNGTPGGWTFERFRGQSNAGYSQYHLKDIRGSLNRFVDCFQWDGMNITIHTSANATIIDGNMITQPVGPARIVDTGFRTDIRASLPSQVSSVMNKYIIEKENFVGADISNRWAKEVTSGASITTHMDTAVPYTFCAKLSTGSTVDAKAALTMNRKKMFQRYNESVVSWKFRIPDISKAIVRMGFKSLADPRTYSSHWGLENDGANFKAFSGAGTLSTIVSKAADTAWHTVQIIKIGESRVLFHIDMEFVGELPPVLDNSELFFEIQTKEAANKDLLIADLYMRLGIY